MISTLLLIGIAWLLWVIHQDLAELTERQRNLKTGLENIAARVDALGDKLDGIGEPAAPTVLVPLNSASKTALRRLPGVGGIIADRIIAARPFAAVEDIRDIEGVTPAMFASIQNEVSLD